MIKCLSNRWEQGHRTSTYPKETILLPERYRGKPVINNNCDQKIIDQCARNCPQEAIDPDHCTIDLGRCVFCGTCERLSQGQFIQFTNDFEFAFTQKKDCITNGSIPDLNQHVNVPAQKLFGKSLQLRQVSAGGCNACEADTNVLNTPFFDLSRFGIQFVASPRHADGLLITGPVTRNMRTALLQTYEAIPSPKIVIAVGSCALSGGPFRGSPDICDDLNDLMKVDLLVPGCPPHPLTILYALLGVIGGGSSQPIVIH
jgi:Ni,Fe-hydrogenase III small subunit/NAD-dependent dihydropyrimidine dehydrogenase PreA subunit